MSSKVLIYKYSQLNVAKYSYMIYKYIYIYIYIYIHHTYIIYTIYIYVYTIHRILQIRISFNPNRVVNILRSKWVKKTRPEVLRYSCNHQVFNSLYLILKTIKIHIKLTKIQKYFSASFLNALSIHVTISFSFLK